MRDQDFKRLRTFTVFYSWQSDRASDLCRNFIDEALKLAAEKIRESRQIIVIIDADTQGVSGTPPISETILKKIDACDAFLADLTLVASTPKGKASPNPNVLIEYGYALKAKGSAHLILTMNTAFGEPQSLPFDLRHLRHPLQYAADDNLAAGERRRQRALFAEKLVVALNAVIDQAPARKKAAAKGPDPEVQASKHLAALKTSRDHGPFPIVRGPRVILDIAPFAAHAERRLDLRTVKTARSWFAPSDDHPASTSTKQDEWLSSDPVDHLLSSYPEARWATRLIAPGRLERIFSISRPVTKRIDQTMDGVLCDSLILTALRRSGALLAAVGLGGPAMVKLTIESGEDLRLVTPMGAGSPLGSSFVTFSAIRIQDLRDPYPEEVRPMLDDFWQACGWEDGTPSIDERGWTRQPFSAPEDDSDG